MSAGLVLRLAVRLVIWSLVVSILLATLWREHIFDFYEKHRLIKLGDDFHDLETNDATLEEFQKVLADRWKPSVVSLRDGRLKWDMEILKYREYRQGHYYLVFEAESGKLIDVQRWPTGY